MKPIIEPVDRQLLKSELKKRFFLRPTNKAGNLIYDFTAKDAPNLMREVGRLRELSFREAGGSTGEELDMDEFDTMEHSYHQLIVWDPDHEEIVGGYRYILCKDAPLKDDGQPQIASSHLFYYSDYFIANYLPYCIELGRAFVQPKYQARGMGTKSLFALDNCWDGLGAVCCNNEQIKYLIGKVTLYPSFDEVSRNLIYAYLRRYHFDTKEMFYPYKPVHISREAQEISDEIFEGNNSTINFSILQKSIRARGFVLPPMFTAYLNLSSTLQYFGTGINDEMSDVYESGILVIVNEIYEDKRKRYIEVYREYFQQMRAERQRVRLERRQARIQARKEKTSS